MKLYVTWSFLLPYYLVPHRPKYLFLHHILEIIMCNSVCFSALCLSPFFSQHPMSCLVTVVFVYHFHHFLVSLLSFVILFALFRCGCSVGECYMVGKLRF